MGVSHYPFDPASFVLLRYCTRPYSFMRQGPLAIIPWLNRFEVPYTLGFNSSKKPIYVYFTPIEEWQRYLYIDESLAKEIKNYKQEIIDKIITVRLSTSLRKCQSAPSQLESAHLRLYADMQPIQ